MLALVKDWHEALNTGDIDRLVALVTPDIEMGGPRGAVSGAHRLREWVARANIRLQPLAYFQRANTVVVEERGQWLAQDSGEIIGDQIVATVFESENGRIRRIARYDDLATALGAAGQSEADRVSAT